MSTKEINYILDSVSNQALSKNILARLSIIEGLFEEKSKEYAVQGAFHNFIRGSELNKIDPRIYLHNLFTKHLLSYLDQITDIGVGLNEGWGKCDEKTGDMIVYLLLFAEMNKTIELNKPADLPF